MTLGVLFVCLGNICRSPAAEAVFINRINSIGIESKFKVDSAGTGGWHIGNQADSRMRKAALNRGINIQSRSRQINLNDFNEFDFILTMDHSNLLDVRSLSKECNSDIKAVIKPILSFSKEYKLEEVPDPYYGGEKGFEEVLDLLEDSIQGFLETINVSD